MIYVGINIAKFNHFSATISSSGEILIEPFKFSNGYDGFYLLLSNFLNLRHTTVTTLFASLSTRILKCVFSTLS